MGYQPLPPSPSKIPPPLSCQSPPLTQQTVQAHLFKQPPHPHSILVFLQPPLKIRFFNEPPKY